MIDCNPANIAKKTNKQTNNNNNKVSVNIKLVFFFKISYLLSVKDPTLVDFIKVSRMNFLVQAVTLAMLGKLLRDIFPLVSINTS